MRATAVLCRGEAAIALAVLIIAAGPSAGKAQWDTTPPTVNIYGGSQSSTGQQQVTVEICEQETSIADYSIILYGSSSSSNVTSQFSPQLYYQAGCVSTSGTIQLYPGYNTLSVMAFDLGENLGSQTSNFYYYPPPIVTPDGHPYVLPAGTGYTYAFRVENPHVEARQHTFALSCTGVASCGAAPGGVTIGAQAAVEVVVTFGVAGSVAATGTVTLTATASQKSDNGSLAVKVLSGGPLVDRSLCLTIAAGPAAAVECGELRVAHGLPAVRTVNAVRAPSLLYNSQHAHPYAIVGVTATLPTGVGTPDSVVTTVTVGGQTYRRSVPGSQFLPAGSGRRAVVGFDATHLATGLYDYTVEVRRFGGGTSAVMVTDTGALPVVNRGTSSFGAGWWLAGYEALQFLTNNRVLWVGGDGSVRVYEQMGTTATHVVYMAAQSTRPDTLLKQTSTGRWQRLLPNGGQVRFTATGQHDSTVNRLNFATRFEHDGSGRLWKITVPPAGAGLAYTFAYNGSGKLATVTVPDSAVGVNRTTTVTIDGTGRLTAITDPGVPAVSFGYDAVVVRRLVTRTDRRGTVTRYRYDASHRVASSALALSSTDSIFVTYCVGESAGLTSCQPSLAAPTDLRTVLDGPRTDTVDVTTFWLGRFGSPVKIQNVYGHETVITRGDARFPGVVTRLRTPDNRVMSAAYDERGNLLALTDSSHARTVGGVTTYARTTYEWHAKWNQPVKITTPEGPFTRFGYDATTGNPLWVEDGRGSSARTNFVYHTSGTWNGLLRAVVKPGGPRDSIAYDATRLNLSATVTPLGKRTLFETDRLGRVRMTRIGNDTAYNGDSLSYDRLNRVMRQVSYGSAINGVAAQRVIVQHTYNAEGLLEAVARSMNPTSPTGIGTLTTNWVSRRGVRSGRRRRTASATARRTITPGMPVRSTRAAATRSPWSTMRSTDW